MKKKNWDFSKVLVKAVNNRTLQYNRVISCVYITPRIAQKT